MKNKIIVASGQNEIDNAIVKFEDYEVVTKIEYKKEIYEACNYFQPNILLVGEGLSGQETLMGVILNLVKDFPNLRIIYFAGNVDMRDTAKVNSLGILVMAGIYDIVHEKKITVQMLKHILDNPKTLDNVTYLTKSMKENSKHSKDNLIEFEIPDEDKEKVDDDIYKNLHVVSSIKPGTGKSFLSTNIATAIANYGVENKFGKKPKVALIEADLQNLSVGTLLQIEDDKKNLKTVMDKISTIVNDNGKFVGTLQQTEEVNAFIIDCFKPYYKVKNLEALVGSQLTIKELEDIKPFYYIYLIDAIIDEYDVVIIDTNSSLTHVTTFPLLHMAKNCYYILNLDFNNVRNNVRYKDFLNEIGIKDKVKYVLNEDILNEDIETADSGVGIEELIFTANHLNDSDFKLEARIPMLPKSVFLNRLYEGTPVVLDDKKYTLKVKYEIMKVANQIWPIKNFKEIEEQVQNLKKKKKKGLFF
ncbi:MAG: ATPase [Clostridiaceae bacterium]|jgi:cellulose biosynthesis protein BcsQ|nr:ATPase [Clostridiaceae bacterium]